MPFRLAFSFILSLSGSAVADSPKGQAFAIDAIWLDGLSFRDAGLEALMSQQSNALSDVGPVQQVDYELEVQTLVRSPEHDDPRWRGLVRLTATLRPQSQPEQGEPTL